MKSGNNDMNLIQRALKVVSSCNTLEQLQVAETYADMASKKAPMGTGVAFETVIRLRIRLRRKYLTVIGGEQWAE